MAIPLVNYAPNIASSIPEWIMSLFGGGKPKGKVEAPTKPRSPEVAYGIGPKARKLYEAKKLLDPDKAAAVAPPVAEALLGGTPVAMDPAIEAMARKDNIQEQIATPGRSAYTMGAPAQNAQAGIFARNLFMGSEKANKDLEQYRKNNPKADANDPNFKRLQDAAAAASADAQAGASWANMSESGRMSVLTQGEKAAGEMKATNMTRGYANEQRNAEVDQWRPDGTKRPTDLLQDMEYYNQTGVMRGGAGEGTSTTQAGGVISAPDKNGTRTLTSPYGTGSVSILTDEQMKKRPEATIEGIPASQYFDKAAMRQGRTFTVGDTTYSPDVPPAKAVDAKLDEAKRKAEEERRKLGAKQLLQPK